jgi:hypothetical protein
VWCGDHTLKVAFPVFSIARHNEALMVDQVQFSNDSLKWNDNFIRSVHDWEVGHFVF